MISCRSDSANVASGLMLYNVFAPVERHTSLDRALSFLYTGFLPAKGSPSASSCDTARHAKCSQGCAHPVTIGPLCNRYTYISFDAL